MNREIFDREIFDRVMKSASAASCSILCGPVFEPAASCALFSRLVVTKRRRLRDKAAYLKLLIENSGARPLPVAPLSPCDLPHDLMDAAVDIQTLSKVARRQKDGKVVSPRQLRIRPGRRPQCSRVTGTAAKAGATLRLPRRSESGAVISDRFRAGAGTGTGTVRAKF